MLSKTLKKGLRAKLEKTFLPKCFTSLDILPVKTWWDINETGNVYLLVRPSYDPNGLRVEVSLDDNEINILNVLLIDMVNQYVKRYGFSEKYKEIVSHNKQIHSHLVNLIVREDNTQKVFIQILEREIKELQEEMSMSKTDNYELKAYLDKQMGFQINVLTCSVSEYMSYVKMMESKSAA